jgi:beta-N-acetylhexosaminidase
MTRRAEAVIVAPVLNLDIATVATATNAGAGGLLLLGNASPRASLQSQLQSAISGGRRSFPPLVMADEEGGGVQRLAPAVSAIPWPRQMAGTMSAGQIQQLAMTVGRQMRALGVNVDLAPVLDVDGGNGPSVTDADGLRSFSPIPSVVSNDGVAFLRGLQAGGVIPSSSTSPGWARRQASKRSPPWITLTCAGRAPAKPFGGRRGTSSTGRRRWPPAVSRAQSRAARRSVTSPTMRHFCTV